METIDIIKVIVFGYLLILLLNVSLRSNFKLRYILKPLFILLKLTLYILPVAVGLFLALKFYSYTEGGVKGIIIAITDVLFLSSPFTYFMIFKQPENEGVMEFIQGTIGLVIYMGLHLIFGMILLLIGALIFGYDPFIF